MALKLQVEQRLERAGLIAYFVETEGAWRRLARNVYRFVRANFPPGATIRPDDVAQNLLPLIEVSEALTEKLDSLKLKQKYWRQDFCHLVIDRCWTTITGGDQE